MSQVVKVVNIISKEAIFELDLKLTGEYPGADPKGLKKQYKRLLKPLFGEGPFIFYGGSVGTVIIRPTSLIECGLRGLVDRSLALSDSIKVISGALTVPQFVDALEFTDSKSLSTAVGVIGYLSQSRTIEFSSPHPPRDQLAPNVSRYLETLSEISKLSNNWDGEGALCLCPNVYDLSVKLLTKLSVMMGSEMALGPIADGGLGIFISSFSFAIHPDWYQVWEVIPDISHRKYPCKCEDFSSKAIEDRFSQVMVSFTDLLIN